MPSSQRCGLDFTHVFCWYDRPWGNRRSRLSTFGVLSLICLRCCVHPIMYALHVPHPDSHRTPKRFVCFVQRSTRQWHCARHHGIGPGVNSLCRSSWYHKCPMVPWSHGGLPWARLDICPIGDQVLRLSVWRHRARRKSQHHAASSSARPPDTAWQRFFKHTICAAQTNFLTIASGLCDKAPVSISMSFCFSRTACIAAFGTRKCEVKSCQFWRNFLGSLSYLNASKLITPLIYLY